MKWPVFLVAAFLVVSVQLSTQKVLQLHSVHGISPDLVAALAVWVALFAQRSSALWACWLLGLIIDLAPARTASPIVGPHALGYVAGGLLVLRLRTMVFRRRAMTVGFLTLVFLIVSGMVGPFILEFRSWYVAEGGLPQGVAVELRDQMLVALYSGVVAIPLGWLLGQTAGLWSFPSAQPRRAW